MSRTGRASDRVTLRTAEVEYALAQIHELEWVDRDRVILMGYSEVEILRTTGRSRVSPRT